MSRLGYDLYSAQGGDIGSAVSEMLGVVDPAHLIGVHVNTDLLAAAAVLTFRGGKDPLATIAVSDGDREQVARMREFQEEGLGYITIQSTRPQTLAYALTDSPVGQLAWIVEKFKEWTDPMRELPDDAVNRDQLLTNVSLYWFTGTAASASRFGAIDSEREWDEPSTLPQGWAVFGGGGNIIRNLMDPEMKIEHWSEFERGGHFAALEVPDLFVDDVRTFFRRFRL